MANTIAPHGFIFELDARGRPAGVRAYSTPDGGKSFRFGKRMLTLPDTLSSQDLEGPGIKLN